MKKYKCIFHWNTYLIVIVLCLGFGVLPLSTIFQWYHASQLYWWRKPRNPEKTTDPCHCIGIYFKYLKQNAKWCLTPFITIFQLYHGDQFYWWGKPENEEKTTDLPEVIDKAILSTPSHEQDSNSELVVIH